MDFVYTVYFFGNLHAKYKSIWRLSFELLPIVVTTVRLSDAKHVPRPPPYGK